MIKKSTADSMRDRIRKRAEQRRNLGGLDTLTLPDGVELYKPEKGTVEFDILPYRVTVDTHPEVKKGELWYERTYFAHRNVGPEEKFLVCPRTIGKRCPICEEYQRLKKDPNVEEEVVDALRAKERELFNVVMKGGDGSVMILDISTFLFGRKLEEEIREGDESYAAFAELVGGKTLKVRWESKSMGTQKFVEAGRIDFTDRDDIDEAALDVVVDLDAAMKILSYEEIDKIFQAGGDEEVEEKSEPEKTPPTRRVIGKARPKAEDDDDQLPGLETKEKDKAPEGGGECIACDGTGKTSKGKTCPICGGTGVDEEIQPTPNQREENHDPARKDDDDLPPDNERSTRRVIGKPKVKEEAPAGRRVIRRGA